MDDPVLVEVTRGGIVESRHRGAFAVIDVGGMVVASAGDIDQKIFPRSTVKAIQALPLVESGAADKYGFGEAELALACASHHGEDAHLAVLEPWLARAGLTPEDLECGAHAPANPAAAAALIRAGKPPSPLHSNCSGKHAGFLTTARHLGEPTRGYIAPDHPVQQRVLATLAAMTGLDLSRAPRGTDGCGIPVIGLPLAGLARAMARMVDPQGVPADRAAAARRLLDAMAAEPLMVAGTASFTSEILAVAGATVRLKPGAEGVFCAALPGRGLGIALKIADGAGRAAETAMGALLVRLGVLDGAQAARLAPLLRPVVRNVAGREVGALRPAAALLQ